MDPSGPTSRKVLRMESKGEYWMDMYASASIRRGQSPASVLENQGRGDFSSHDGSLPSCSSSSSERYSSTDLIDRAAEATAILEDGEVHTMLQDAEVRAVLRKVTINEGVLNMAIQSLGGGEKGLQSLMEYVMVWVKQQRDIQSSSQKPPPPPPSTRTWNFSTAEDVFLQPSFDAFQILSGILQPPPTTQVPDEDVHPFQRLKSRKLMIGEPEMGVGLGGVDTGFCPSSSIRSPEDCQTEVTSPNRMAPCSPQLHCGIVESTPAMSTKAARRYRMSRQRQSFHARAASPVATAPVSVGGGSLWNTDAPTSPAVTSSGISGAQTTPNGLLSLLHESTGEVWERLRGCSLGVFRLVRMVHTLSFYLKSTFKVFQGRSMECLTVLLQKELRPSDVNHLGRIILPKKAAEHRMPSLGTRGGVPIQMEDFDSGHVWNLRYRFWPNNKSRMYVLENTAAFVTSHGLVEGDLLVLYRILQGGYVLRGMKKENGRRDIEPVQVEFAYSSAKGSLEGQRSPHENGTLVQRLYGCCPSDKSVKEEPANLDDVPYLNEVILSINPWFQSDSSCIQTLERFPSLALDFPFEEIVALTRTEPDRT